MKCENYFCIYEEKGECVLKEIKIDITGQCDSCIYIDVPELQLDNYKNQLKNRMKDY